MKDLFFFIIKKLTRATSAALHPHDKRQGVPRFFLFSSDVERINCLGFSLISHFAADRRDERQGEKPGRHMKARSVFPGSLLAASPSSSPAEFTNSKAGNATDPRARLSVFTPAPPTPPPSHHLPCTRVRTVLQRHAEFPFLQHCAPEQHGVPRVCFWERRGLLM